jgi:TetR/AcrR family transcriptional repressor of nem operon
MPRMADPNEIPERLIQAGLELFLQQGFNATGIQQITERAGVPKGSFYNHFESKEAFGAAIVDRYSEWNERSWQHMMRRAPAEPLAAIRHVFEQMLQHHEKNRAASGCLIGNFAAEVASSSAVCRRRLLAAQLAWRQRLADLIVRGQQQGEIRTDMDPEALSALTWSVWEGALLRMKVEGSVRPLRDSMALVLERVYPPSSVPVVPTIEGARRARRSKLS